MQVAGGVRVVLGESVQGVPDRAGHAGAGPFGCAAGGPGAAVIPTPADVPEDERRTATSPAPRLGRADDREPIVVRDVEGLWAAEAGDRSPTTGRRLAVGGLVPGLKKGARPQVDMDSDGRRFVRARHWG